MDRPDAIPTGTEPSRWPPGWHVEVVDETGSTNADLLAAVAAGAPDRSVRMARHQTAGRGRLDRRWEAPPGANLLVSLLFRGVVAPPHELVQRVGLAALDACERIAGVRASLKWPNDLLVDDRKLAGILAQSTAADDGRVVVVGIGLNIGWAPDGAARLGDGIVPETVLFALLEAFDSLPVDLHDRYRERLGTLGRTVRVQRTDDTIVEGRALDVEADGRLVVLDGCGITHRIDTGDVTHLR